MAQGHYSESRPFFGQPPLRSVNRRAAPPRPSRTHEREDFEVTQVRKRQKREEDARTGKRPGVRAVVIKWCWQAYTNGGARE